MVLCDRCGNDVYMPFRCSYCGGYFCAEHRLPEFHGCTGFHRGPRAVNGGRTTSYHRPDAYHRRPRGRFDYGGLFRFSEREVRDLAISLLLISTIPLQWLGRFIFRRPTVVIGAVTVVAAAFLLHELAHKFSAQRLGYWAEFRLNTLGVLITLMSFFSPLKIVAPGAVVIAGLMYGDDYGKVSLAGPLVNIAQAVLFLTIRLLSGDPLVGLLVRVGIIVNSSLALFNLIPFGIFDGAKIFRWDWRVWLASIAAAGVLYFHVAM